jgi:hypothetical protein
VTVLLYLVGSAAGLAFAVAVIFLARQSDLLSALAAVNPLWLLVAVVALGLGGLIALAEAASGTLARLDGWSKKPKVLRLRFTQATRRRMTRVGLKPPHLIGLGGFRYFARKR